MTRDMGKTALCFGMILLILIKGLVFAEPAQEQQHGETVKVRSLEECLRMALEQHRAQQISRDVVEIAEAQHGQALSAYWPQVFGYGTVTRRDEDLDFLFPENTSTYTVSGLAPVPVEAEVIVPDQQVKTMDRDVLYGSLNVMYPVYLGGKRSARAKQAELGVHIATHAARRTELEIIYDVTRMYWGVVLAGELRQLGQETHDRFRAMLKLTEQFYQTGSGTVKKTDYLRTQAITSSIDAVLAQLTYNEILAQSALANTMGLPWETSLEVTETTMAVEPFEAELSALVTDAYAFNPDWAQLELALEAAEAAIKEAKSAYMPVVALTGRVDAMANTYESGMMTEANRESWSVGMSVNVPIFNGFRTTHDVKAARARLEKLTHERLLFAEGLALQVKDAFLHVDLAQHQLHALDASAKAAEENLDLSARAYQHELVETEDVIQAQLLKAFTTAQVAKTRYDCLIHRARLEWIIGQGLKPLF